MLNVVALDIENQFTFLQSICYKQFQHFDKSQKEYRKLEAIFRSRQGYKLAKYVFTNLMLPMQVQRKIVENYVQYFLDNIQITNEDAYWDDKVQKPLAKILHYKHQTWENIDQAVKYLREMPLFKRLEANGYTYQ